MVVKLDQILWRPPINPPPPTHTHHEVYPSNKNTGNAGLWDTEVLAEFKVRFSASHLCKGNKKLVLNIQAWGNPIVVVQALCCRPQHSQDEMELVITFKACVEMHPSLVCHKVPCTHPSIHWWLGYLFQCTGFHLPASFFHVSGSGVSTETEQRT